MEEVREATGQPEHALDAGDVEALEMLGAWGNPDGVAADPHRWMVPVSGETPTREPAMAEFPG